jgi:hypothetical protein
VALLTAILTGDLLAQVPSPSNGPGLGLKKQMFDVRLLSPINSATAKEGDSFTATVDAPPDWQGGVVTGRITKVQRPQRGLGKGSAQVMFVFDSLTFNGRTARISAVLKDVSNSKGVKNVDEEGRVIGKSSNKKRTEAALGGALIGALVGGLRGGGSGAAAGAAIGAGAGLATAITLTTTGTDIEFRPGSHFSIEVSDARSDQSLSASQPSAYTPPPPSAPLVRAPYISPSINSTVYNQQLNPGQKDPRALELLSQVQRAMGGKSALAALRDWQRVTRNTWTVNGGTTMETTTFAAPLSIREESVGGNRTVTFSDGETGWAWSSDRRVRNVLPTDTATKLSFHTLPALLLSDADPERAMILDGPSAILFADKHNNRVLMTVDPISLLPKQINWTNLDGAELQEVYWDWRPNASIMWWFQMARYRNNQQFLQSQVLSLRPNRGVTAQQISEP